MAARRLPDARAPPELVDNQRVTDAADSVDPVDGDTSFGAGLVLEPWGAGVAGATGSWRLERATGTASAAHDLEMPLERRAVRLHRVVGPALVLGSTQAEDLVDRAATRAAGVEVARRRSGGGAVFLVPGEQAWIDVAVPAGDPLWDADVGRASWWLGEVWAETIARLTGPGGARPTVHHDGVDDRELGRLVCFAALGPGEVALGGRKVVGISQRRTRAGARFQCVVYRRWDPAPLLSMLRLGDATDRVVQVLHTRAGAVGAADEVGAVDAADAADAADGVDAVAAVSPQSPSPVADARWSVVEEFLRRLP